MSTGANLRDAAIERVTSATPDREEWRDAARAIARQVYRSLHRPISTDDVAPHLPPMASDWDRRIMTACFPRTEWKRVGWKTSQERTCHARPKALWVPA